MVETLLNWLEFLILPPGFSIFLLFIALILSRKTPYVSLFISITSVLLLVLLSMPLTARYLLQSLQQQPALQLTELVKNESNSAIIILGGGRYPAAPEYGYRDEISAYTLGRLRYGAELAEQLNLPILLSGGRRNSEATSEAVIMNQLMVSVFKINPQYLEITSTNTAQQAIEAKKILSKKNINKIYLVTHAWHMKRASRAFEIQGFEVIHAPMGFAGTGSSNYRFMPTAFAMASSSRALHEYYALFYLNLISGIGV